MNIKRYYKHIAQLSFLTLIICPFILAEDLISNNNSFNNIVNNRTDFSINDFDGDPDNALNNSSFENYYVVEGSDWQQLPNNWEGYPHMNNMDVVLNGEDLGFGAGIFTSYDGMAGLKMWGLYDGENTENNIFQTWYDSTLGPGLQFDVSAELMSPAGDFIGNGNNYVVLFAKYFTADWDSLGMNTSDPFNAENAVGDEWQNVYVSCEVPEEASIVQVGAMYAQATNDDHGPVILDDFHMHIPLNESYWLFETSENNDPTLGYINHSIITDPVFEGSGAMQIDYSVHNIESWGGYAKIYHMHPNINNGGFYDWSNYNTLSITYYNMVSSSESGSVHMRINLSDYAEIDDPSYTGLGEYYYSFHYILDNEPGWNTIDIPLERTDDWEGNGFNLTGWVGDNGNGTLETHAIGGFHFEFSIAGSGEGNYADGTIIFDDFSLKNLSDSDPPEAPTGLSIVDGEYYNFILWDDVPNETNESYRIYASMNPNDLSGEESEVVALVPENTNGVIHYLYAPINDESISYYYAIECIDNWGNVSELSILGSSFTNSARGIPVISSTSIPENLVVNGNLNEWYSSAILPFEIGSSYNSWGTPNVSWGQIDGDEDLYGTLYMGIDQNNLYIAAHIQDDQYNGYSGDGNWWEHDAFELFLGLYNQSGERHWEFQRGNDPDYQFVFLQDYMYENQTFNENGLQYDSGSGNYVFNLNENSYTIEAVLPLNQIAGDLDNIYLFQNNDRIPIEPTIHDNDGNGREGVLACSPINMDNAWQTPSVWSSTFIYPSEMMIPLQISSSEEYVIHGDSLLVGIHINDLSVPLSSINLSFSGFEDKMTVLNVLLDDESLMGSQGWYMEYNDTDDLLITAAAGSEDIIGNGRLFSIEFLVHDTVSSQTIDVNISDYLGNEDLFDYISYSGGVHVLWLPEANFSSDITSGAYPLEVTFEDNSVSGTYPIVQWEWNFGNGYTDEGQSVSTVYEYPGHYDVELSVTDEFGLNNSMLLDNYIVVDTTYGDVDFNTIVDLSDVYMMLEYTVGIIAFDSLSISVGDVTRNNAISNLDASIALLYLEGVFAQLPPPNCCGWAEATGDIILENQNAEPEMEIYVPVGLSGGSNIYGFTGTINYDPNIVSLDSLEFSGNTNSYITVLNMIEPGMVTISASGVEVLGETGTVFTVVLYVNENFTEETTISITNFSWNEEDPIEIAAEMTIGVGLSVDALYLPNAYAIHQNYPNPFNPLTNISYDLPENSFVDLVVYDMMGRIVKNLIHGNQNAGVKNINWDATNTQGETVSAGVYIYMIKANNYIQSRKMILLK